MHGGQNTLATGIKHNIIIHALCRLYYSHEHNVKGIVVPLVVATKSTTIPMIDSSV